VFWLAKASGSMIHPSQKALGRAIVGWGNEGTVWLAEVSGSMIHPSQKAREGP